MMKDIVINGYTLKSFLGKGGMAEVWLAENNLGKKAAIKIMLPKFIGEKQVISRFETEAKAMVKLNHPNIRQVMDYGEYENRPFIIMEYLEGKDLSQWMSEDRKFTDAEIEKWWKQSISALTHTHEQGIIHRDIKPSNIFLQANGDIKILDFGISKVKDEISVTSTGQGLGTILYMSPEQIKDPKRVTTKTDIYSLGATFATILKGKPLIDTTKSDSTFEIWSKIIGGELDLSGISERWLKVFKPCLEVDPKERISTGTEIRGLDDNTEIHQNEEDKTVVISTNTEDETVVIPPKTGDETEIIITEGEEGEGEEEEEETTKVEKPTILSKINTYKKTLIHIGIVAILVIVGFYYFGNKRIRMVYVSGGTFMMGCTDEQGSDCYKNEKPAHRVTLSSYYIGKYPVTQKQWRSVMGSGPTKIKI